MRLSDLEKLASQYPGATLLIAIPVSFKPSPQPRARSDQEGARDAGRPSIDRAYWEAKASPEAFALFDELAAYACSLGPDLTLNYRSTYIGMARRGRSRNFVAFVPNRNNIRLQLHIRRDAKIDARIAQAGLTTNAYDLRLHQYSLSVSAEDVAQRGDVLKDLIGIAHRSR